MNPLHPLVQRLLDQPESQVLAPESLDAWLARGGVQVLFFGGDPARFPEALDVAVVLPELRAAAGGFAIGVVPRAHEDAIARRFGVQRWPSLVFLRDGGWLGALAGMRDWDDYRREIAEIVARPATRVPTVGIPVVAAGAASGGCA